MIELNLLPEEIRRRKAKTKIKIPREFLFRVGGSLIGIIILANLILAGILFIKKIRYSSISKKWEAIQPDKNRIDNIKEELSTLGNRVKYVEQLTTERIAWAEELNRISDLIPRGVWLSNLTFSEPVLRLEGSAVSKEKQESILVARFTTALKKDPKISSDFQDIDVQSIQRRKIKTLEVVDFVITANLKRQEEES